MLSNFVWFIIVSPFLFAFGDPGPMDVFSGYIVIVVGIVIGFFSFNVFAISENTIVISITLLASNAVGVIIIGSDFNFPCR